MQILIGFIKKVLQAYLHFKLLLSMYKLSELTDLFQDKQVESLVEKLCNRLTGVSGIESTQSADHSISSHP